MLSFVVLLIFNKVTLMQVLVTPEQVLLMLRDEHNFAETAFNSVLWLLR